MAGPRHCRSLRLRRRFFNWRQSITAMLLIAQSPESAFDQAGQLVRCGVDGLVYGIGMSRYGKGMVALKTSLHHAALVVLPALEIFCCPVFIAQMHLNARYMIAEWIQGVLYNVTDVSGQRFVTCDVVVGIDLHLHSFLLVVVMGSIPEGGSELVCSTMRLPAISRSEEHTSE